MFTSNKQYKDSKYEKIISLIGRDSSKLLDVGCGDGYLENRLGNHNFDITGLDVSKECISQARDNFPDSHYFVSDACESFRFNDNTFDVVVSNGLLEHVEKPSNVVKECLRVCKGVCIIGTPNAYHFDLYYGTQKHSLSDSVFQYYTPNVLRGLITKFGGVVDYVNFSAFIPPFKYILTRSNKLEGV